MADERSLRRDEAHLCRPPPSGRGPTQVRCPEGHRTDVLMFSGDCRIYCPKCRRTFRALINWLET